jgi:hypothetical protein
MTESIQNGLGQPTLNSVAAIRAASEPDVYILDINLTDRDGATYDGVFISRPSDPFGLGPAVRQWIVDHPEFPVDPYVPPTAEEIRSAMAPVTRRQLRLALVRNGVSLSAVDASIAAMPNGTAKDEAQIEWADASTFDRMHPTLLLVGGALGLTAEQIDAMWAQALAI